MIEIVNLMIKKVYQIVSMDFVIFVGFVIFQWILSFFYGLCQFYGFLIHFQLIWKFLIEIEHA